MPEENSDLRLTRSAFLRRGLVGILVGATLVSSAACGMEEDDEDDEDDD